MYLKMIRALGFLAIILLMPAATVAQGDDCIWRDVVNGAEPIIRVESGNCSFSDLQNSENIEVQGGSALVLADIIVRPTATLILRGQDILELRLAISSGGYANIITEGPNLVLDHVTITSFDRQSGGPDLNIDDGRSFIRVDSCRDEQGIARLGRLEMDNSKILYLGFESRGASSDYSGYGLSLKVRREDALNDLYVTGWIRSSQISHNYRGFYSYGARYFDFSNNIVTFNLDYGVDPHDDSSGFVARDNVIAFNAGTGLALSRRCDASIVVGNTVIRNGANGILVHDLSNNTLLIGNVVSGNRLDGIVVHDSHGILIEGNGISDNRNGIRLFAGAVGTYIRSNVFFQQREATIWLLHGALDQAKDLGDYSNGPRWNAQNISRHNDGRVWVTRLVENDFMDESEIALVEAMYFHASGNRYRGDVSFDVSDSHEITLDGRGAEGRVQYRLRRGDIEPVTYAFDPPDNAVISVVSGDRIALMGETAYFPRQNQNFTLELNSDERPTIVAAGRVGSLDIQSGQLIAVPIAATTGQMTLSSYLGDMSLGDPVRLELTSTSWEVGAITLAYGECALFEWVIEGGAEPGSFENVFFHDASDPIDMRYLPIPAAGRVIADVRCVPGLILDSVGGSL